MPFNRCVECNKFRPWEDLIETLFISDHYAEGIGYGKEESEFTCKDCIKKDNLND